MKLKKINETYHVCFKAEDGSMMQADTKQTVYTEAKLAAEQAKVSELERVANITRLTGEIVTKIVSGKNLFLRDALSRYEVWANNNLSRRTAQSHVSYAAKFIRDFDLEGVVPELVKDEDVSDFVNPSVASMPVYGAKGIKGSTRRVRKAAIKSFLDYCYNKGWMTHRPAHLCRVKMDLMTHEQKETKSHPRMTGREIRYLMMAGDTFWKTAIHLASETGLRLGDICSLEWACIDHGINSITVWTDKRDKRVVLMIPQDLADCLSQLPVEHTTYVFPKERDIYRNPTRRARLSNEFKKVIHKAADLCYPANAPLLTGAFRKKSFHGLRGYYARKKTKDGATKEEVAKDLGHSSTKTTDIYIGASTNEKDKRDVEAIRHREIDRAAMNETAV